MTTERLSNRQIATLRKLAICCSNGGQITLTRDERGWMMIRAILTAPPVKEAA